jgi:hypothetical protein
MWIQRVKAQAFHRAFQDGGEKAVEQLSVKKLWSGRAGNMFRLGT